MTVHVYMYNVALQMILQKVEALAVVVVVVVVAVELVVTAVLVPVLPASVG